MQALSKKNSVLAILALIIVSLVLTLSVFSSLAGAASIDAGVTDSPAKNDVASHRLNRTT